MHLTRDWWASYFTHPVWSRSHICKPPPPTHHQNQTTVFTHLSQFYYRLKVDLYHSYKCFKAFKRRIFPYKKQIYFSCKVLIGPSHAKSFLDQVLNKGFGFPSDQHFPIHPVRPSTISHLIFEKDERKRNRHSLQSTNIYEFPCQLSNNVIHSNYFVRYYSKVHSFIFVQINAYRPSTTPPKWK